LTGRAGYPPRPVCFCAVAKAPESLDFPGFFGYMWKKPQFIALF
jgi:hypothetical protein